jgi:uncharacterized protein YecT (DUF1311 family)
MRTVVALLIMLAGYSGAPDAKADPWGQRESGLERAEAIITQCLERSEGVPPNGSEPCVGAVFAACGSEHGNMSQHDLNDCAFFSKNAWEAGLASIRAKLLSAKTVRGGSASAPMVRNLAESERRWDDWNRADCELQAALSEGGSMHSMEIGTCLSNHAAHRALELKRLEFWWAKAFQLTE